MNKNKNTVYPSFCNIAKVELKGKFIAIIHTLKKIRLFLKVVPLQSSTKNFTSFIRQQKKNKRIIK